MLVGCWLAGGGVVKSGMSRNSDSSYFFYTMQCCFRPF